MSFHKLTSSVDPSELISLPDSGWVMHASEIEDDNCIPGSDCEYLAPKNFASEGLSVADLSYKDLIGFQGRSLWLKISISPALLKNAFERRLNYLVLGKFYSNHQVWLDGEILDYRPRSMSNNPRTIELPFSRLKQDRPLEILVRVIHDEGAIFPFSFKGVFYQQGFTSGSNFLKIKRVHDASTFGAPLILTTAYFFIGLLFGLIWFTDKRYRESSTLTAFVMFYALTNSLSLLLWNEVIDFSSYNKIRALFAVQECIIVVYLSLVFCRIRVVKPLLPWLVFTPLAIPLFLTSSESGFLLERMIKTYFLPMAFVAAGVISLMHAKRLNAFASQSRLLDLKTRALNLMLFAGVMFGLLLLTLSIQTTSFFHLDFIYAGVFGDFQQAVTLVLLVFLAYVILRDSSHRASLSENTMISPLHRYGKPARAIKAIILNFDIKKSEILFFRTKSGGEAIARNIINSIWVEINRHGGFVISTEGDGLLAFVEIRAGKESRSFEKLMQLTERIQAIVEEFSTKHADGKMREKIKFRLSLVEGTLEPIWHEIEGRKYPSWRSLDNPSAFLTSARLLSADKEIDPMRHFSNLIVGDEISSAFSSALQMYQENNKWGSEFLKLENKNGFAYSARIYKIDGETILPENASDSDIAS